VARCVAFRARSRAMTPRPIGAGATPRSDPRPPPRRRLACRRSALPRRAAPPTRQVPTPTSPRWFALGRRSCPSCAPPCCALPGSTAANQPEARAHEAPLWRRIEMDLERRRVRRRYQEAKEAAWLIAPETIAAGFGRVLRREREDRGLSAAALARTVGTSPDHPLDLERGQKSPSLRTVARVAHALLLRPSELLARVEMTQGHEPPGSASVGLENRRRAVGAAAPARAPFTRHSYGEDAGPEPAEGGRLRVTTLFAVAVPPADWSTGAST
jgi:transcriptional regulator with XRE-family HTH domain